MRYYLNLRAPKIIYLYTLIVIHTVGRSTFKLRAVAIPPAMSWLKGVFKAKTT